LRGKPFLHAGSPIEDFAADVRPWRPHAEHFPTVERPRVSQQFSGELFLGQKIYEE
jgi:hypothetical protein